MSTRTFSQSCPYDGCTYVSKSTSHQTNEHNLGSHTSNRHGQKTKVWYGATQVTILRDLNTKEMTCPCGWYSNKDASLVRRHALKTHKGSVKTMRDSSPVASSSAAEPSEPSSPSPATPHIGNPSSHGSALAAHVSSKAKLQHIPAPAGTAKSGRASLNPSSDTLPRTKREEAQRGNLSVPAASSSSSLKSVLSSTPVDGTLSKPSAFAVRQPVSSWRDRLAANFQDSLSSRSNADRSGLLAKRVREEDGDPGPPSKAPRLMNLLPPPIPRLQASSSRDGSKRGPRTHRSAGQSYLLDDDNINAFVKGQIDEYVPPEAPSSTRRTCSICSSVVKSSLNYWQNRLDFKCNACVIKGATTAAQSKAGPSTSVSAIDAKPTVPATVGPQPIPPSTRAPSTQAEAAPPVFLVTCDVCRKPIRCSQDWKKTRPNWTCGACIVAETARAGTATASASPTSATPHMAPRPKPRPRPRVRHSEVPPALDEVKQPAAVERPATPPADQRRAVVDPSSPMSSVTDKASALPRHSNDSDVSDSEPARAAAVQAKPRRQRISKQMRARAFRLWFDGVLEDLRARKASGDVASSLFEDRTDYMKAREIEKDGGTAYTTPEEFFAAAAECLREHKRATAQGRRERLVFHGGYSLVAQPKIGHLERGKKVIAQLRELGWTLDDARVQHGLYSSSRANGTGQVKHIWMYPCVCGGAPVPKVKGKGAASTEGRLEACGGVVALHVGDDFALEAYGIKGQFISVHVEHW